MVTQATNMSLSSKRAYLARIHGRYQRAGRPHKSRILDEFCLNCDYHRKAALRLLLGPGPGALKKRPGPKRTYDHERLRAVLKIFWLASDQLCSKRLHAALPEERLPVKCGECNRQPGGLLWSDCGAEGGWTEWPAWVLFGPSEPTFGRSGGRHELYQSAAIVSS